jgi:hypothetical protein
MLARLGDVGAPTKIIVFAVGLALVGGAAALAGAATDHGSSRGRGVTNDAMSMSMDHSGAAPQSQTNGLASVAGGYAFVPAQSTLPLGKTTSFRFRIVDSRGQAVRHFDLDGGVRLHLIVVRRDFIGYQHVHPTLEQDGSWSVPLKLSAPGVYRAFADFDQTGQNSVLGHDLFVPGEFVPARLPPPSPTVSTDGYTVDFPHSALHAGKASELRFAISRRGKPVTSFEPYVGHPGHLIVLRDGDLAYSHVHPLPSGGAGRLVFHTELPSAGRYRLFLQFKLGGVVHTAPFTVGVQR